MGLACRINDTTGEMRLSAEWEKQGHDTIKATIIARLDWATFESLNVSALRLGHKAVINVRRAPSTARMRRIVAITATNRTGRVWIRQPMLGSVEVRVMVKVGRGEAYTPTDVAAIARDILDMDDPSWCSLWQPGVWADVEPVQL